MLLSDFCGVERLKTRAAFDASYALSLSADAVPALVEGVAELKKKQRETVARMLLVPGKEGTLLN